MPATQIPARFYLDNWSILEIARAKGVKIDPRMNEKDLRAQSASYGVAADKTPSEFITYEPVQFHAAAFVMTTPALVTESDFTEAIQRGDEAFGLSGGDSGGGGANGEW